MSCLQIDVLTLSSTRYNYYATKNMEAIRLPYILCSKIIFNNIIILFNTIIQLIAAFS